MRGLIRKTRSLTSKPFGAAIVLPFPYGENLRVVLEEKLAVLQVYWGDFPRERVEEAHRAGVKVLHQVRANILQISYIYLLLCKCLFQWRHAEHGISMGSST